jgi:hypothetical protein
MVLKKILNLPEKFTHTRLRNACEESGAEVFAKLRIADVFPIEGSGITDKLYGYALKAHFDFLVTDAKQNPLFAVEFDGPSHDLPDQEYLDAQKNELCERFELPLLRINRRYLTKNYGSLDLLTWFIEVWFLERGFEAAQLSGHIPMDEPFDYRWLWQDGEKGRRWDLSVEAREGIRRLSDEERCWDPGASWIVGTESAGTYRALGYLRITPSEGITVITAMQKQRFPAPIDELLGDIVTTKLYQRLLAVLEGREVAESVKVINESITNFERRYKFVSASSVSRGTPLRR